MTLDVVNGKNEKVGSVELSDEMFGVRVNDGLIWQSVVYQNAVERRGTHATKTRGNVSGAGRKPWRQKGTGRARVGEVRTPLWRGGGTVFGPQPRSYAYHVPKKAVRRSLQAALTQKLRDGGVTVVEELGVEEPKTKLAKELLTQLGVTGRTVLVDVKPSEDLDRSVRNMPKIRVVASNRLTARDVMGSRQLVITRTAVEHLAQVLSS